MKIGNRVAAIACSDQKKIELYGYGEYLGKFMPPKGIFCLGFDMNEVNLENPKIQLDNGQVVSAGGVL